MLFVIGGNGSHAGANAIHEEVQLSLLFHTSRTLGHVWMW